MIKVFFTPLEKMVREIGRVTMMFAESVYLVFKPPFKFNYIFKQNNIRINPK